MTGTSALSSCIKGTKAIISKLEVTTVIAMRLSEMGILPESEVIVVNNPSSGPIIVRSKQSNIALHRNIADNTIVVTT